MIETLFVIGAIITGLSLFVFVSFANDIRKLKAMIAERDAKLAELEELEAEESA